MMAKNVVLPPLSATTVQGRIVAGRVVLVHSTLPPGDSDWDRVLDFLQAAAESDVTRTFVWSSGGAPNASQRAAYHAALGAARPLTSFVTGSIVARDAATSLALLNPNCRVFAPHEIDAALDYLDTSARDRDALLAALEGIHARHDGRLSSRRRREWIA